MTTESEIPPMPPAPERAPAVNTRYWDAESWKKWEAVQRSRAAALNAWEEKYRHRYSVERVAELYAACVDKDDWDRAAVYARVYEVLTGKPLLPT